MRYDLAPTVYHATLRGRVSPLRVYLASLAPRRPLHTTNGTAYAIAALYFASGAICTLFVAVFAFA